MHAILLKIFAPFVLTLLIGLFSGSALNLLTARETVGTSNHHFGIGMGYGFGVGSGKTVDVANINEPLRILYQRRATYTEKARKNKIQGIVRLQVLFHSSGVISSVSLIGKMLPYDLTENAIAAAREIKFEPEKFYGKPVTTSKILEYRFNNASYKKHGAFADIKSVEIIKRKP